MIQTHAVAEEGRAPARENTAHTFSCTDSAESLYVALVEPWIDLAATFDQVEGCHGSVGKALVYM